MITDEEVNAFLEHHGVKGQRWGVRAAKTVGRGTATTAKAIGRGTKATAKWSWKHKKAAASIAAGTIAVGFILKGHHNMRVKDLQIRKEVFNESKTLLNTHKNIRMSELSDIASRGNPGGVIRGLANQEQHSLVKNHEKNLIRLAKQVGVKPSQVL